MFGSWARRELTDFGRCIHPEDAEADVETTLTESHEALDVLRGKAQTLGQKALRRLGDAVAGAGDPARHRRTMDPVEQSDLLDVEPLGNVQAKRVTLVGREHPDGVAKRAPEGLLVALAQALELGVTARLAQVDEVRLVVALVRRKLDPSDHVEGGT